MSDDLKPNLSWVPIEDRRFQRAYRDTPTRVTLYGSLAQVAQRNEFLIDIGSVREAVRALGALTEGRVTKHIAETNDSVGWRVVVNGRAMTMVHGEKMDEAIQVELELIRDDLETIEIFPVPFGAKGGLLGILEIILGIVLIVVGIFLGGLTSLWGTWLLGLGASLALGGLASLIMGTGEQSQPKEKNPKQQPSYLFNGQVNTTSQGGPVPILYGNMIVGSQLITASLTTTKYPVGVLGENQQAKPAVAFDQLMINRYTGRYNPATNPRIA